VRHPRFQGRAARALLVAVGAIWTPLSKLVVDVDP
jgi:hypothetical protein